LAYFEDSYRVTEPLSFAWNRSLMCLDSFHNNYTNMKKVLLFTILLVALIARAQSYHADSLTLGNFVAPIRGDGALYQTEPTLLGPGLQWPNAIPNSIEGTMCYEGHIWFGGLDSSGEIHMAAETFNQQGFSYYPGLANFDDTQWDSVWMVTRTQIDQFRADFANNTVNFANYPVIRHWPAFGLDRNGVQKACAPFVDMDNDPLHYSPTAGDYPDVLGDQAIYFQFTDDPGNHNPYLNPLKFEVRALAYVYDCTELENVIFLKYDVTNPTNMPYTDFRMGLWHDFDIGNPFDDYIGTNLQRKFFFGYNGDANDETASGYGLQPPAIGITFLNNETAGAMYYNNDFSPTGNPFTVEEHFNYLNSRWKDSTTLVNNGLDGWQGTASGTTTTFPFSGNPGWCGGPSSGWTELNAGNAPYDRRGLIATPQNTFAPGQTRSYTFAVMIARGYYNDNLGSVCELLTLNDSVRHWFANNELPCESASTAISGSKATSLAAELLPNPSHDRAVLRFENPMQLEAELRLFDITGREIQSVQTTFSNEFNVDVSSLSAGVYYVRMQMGDGVFAGKLIKE
jgi:hypothetical protein